MKRSLACVAFVAATSGAALGQCNIDQNQPNAFVYMAAFSQTDLAQSFQHQTGDNICGAGIFLQPNIGGTDNVRISLWDALPNQGGNMLAEASAQGTQGQWVDVFWSAVNINLNTTYYLVFDGNTTLGISGDVNNPYPHGQVYANPGFGSFPNFDYTFRTYSSQQSDPTIRLVGDCPGVVGVFWADCPPNQPMAIAFAYNTGSFVIPGGPCAGTELGLGGGGLRVVYTGNTGPDGSGETRGEVPACACGRFLQMIIADGNPCSTTNVAQIP